MDTDMEIPVDMTVGAWGHWLTNRVDAPDVEPDTHHTPHTTHEYTRITTYKLGTHTRTKHTRIISTYNPTLEETAS